MSQENYTKVPTNWVLLEDLIPNFDSSKTYQIYNNGISTIKCLESDTLPADDAEGGRPLYQDCTAVYEKGAQNVYVKALSDDTYVNITKVG